MEDNRTRILESQREGKPILLGFSPYGHMEDLELTGMQKFGRKTGLETPEDLTVLSPAVSRDHGEFGLMAGRGFYRDLGSSNGTYINGKLCSEIYALQDGDILSFRFKNSGELSYLLIYTISQSGYEWEKLDLSGEIHEIVIGRERNPSEFRDRMISRNHAVFLKSEDGWSITDLESTNGVCVNGIRVTERTVLQEYDVIRIGCTWFVYLKDQLWIGKEKLLRQQEEEQDFPEASPERQEVSTMEGEYLNIHIRERNVWKRLQKKTLLKDIDLQIAPGEFVLILGGSGAGKSTFMKAVIGYEKAEGEITLGDVNIYDDYEKVKYEIGYVPQKDLIRDSDSVYHTVLAAAKMKMEDGLPEAEYIEQAEWVIHLLGLAPDRQTLAGRLSGGQRKRLSIAVELVGDPRLFFLDEPDSGLDGVMARELMLNLKRISDMGKIVMVISHGPDRAADLFTKVLVLAKSQEDQIGHLAFFGGVEEAKDYFEVNCLEDIVRRINRTDEGGEGLADEFIRRAENSRRMG
ncbi:MAG: ATP-binding cassette domain-containing protein [Eubacteriales bacterium]|nr:ATP-binding cassette domain-containing protein [Eubacteriales bacterium]